LVAGWTGWDGWEMGKNMEKKTSQIFNGLIWYSNVQYLHFRYLK
jgi:hypothetical protein